MVDQTNESTQDQPMAYSVVGKLFGGGGALAPRLPSSDERPAAPPLNLRASSKGITERATVEEEEDRAFIAKVANMKYVFGKPKLDAAPAPVVTTAYVGATEAAEPTLLSKLAASAPKLQPPPFLSKRSDAQPKATEAAAAPEHATRPRSSSLIERMLDGERARAGA
jgi:hypothetical protein